MSVKEHGGAESRKTSCDDLGFRQYNQLCVSLTKQARTLTCILDVL